MYALRGWLPPFHQSEVASLCKAVATEYPFKQVLEIGIVFGQAFEVLTKVLPDVKFVGVSNDAATILRLRRFFHTRLNAELVKEELDNLKNYADGSFDVSYSCGVLSLCDRNEAAAILKELRRVTSGNIFLLELQALGEYDSEMVFYAPQAFTNLWVRDYVKLAAEVLGHKGKNVNYSRVERPQWEGAFWRNYGSIVTIRCDGEPYSNVVL